jgi:hypothetical protein
LFFVLDCHSVRQVLIFRRSWTERECDADSRRQIVLPIWRCFVFNSYPFAVILMFFTAAGECKWCRVEFSFTSSM